MANLAAVPPLTPPQDLLLPAIPANTDPEVTVTPTTYQVTLPPSVRRSDGSVATLGMRSGHSSCALRCQQAWYNLRHLLLITYLINRPPLVEAIVGCPWRSVMISKPYAFQTDLRRLPTTPTNSYPFPDTPTSTLVTAVQNEHREIILTEDSI